MPNDKEFKSLMNNLKKDVESLAGLTVRRYRRQAIKDGKSLLRDLQSDLKRWNNLLEQGLLSTVDFEWLVASQSASAQMSALENSGLALARADQFRGSVINLVIDTSFDLILGANTKSKPTAKRRSVSTKKKTTSKSKSVAAKKKTTTKSKSVATKKKPTTRSKTSTAAKKKTTTTKKKKTA